MLKKYNIKWAYSVFMALLFMPINTSIGQTITAEEVKASYMLKLGGYTQVDSPPRAIATICYYEKAGVPLSDSVGQILEKYVQSKPLLNGKPISVKKFQAIRNLNNCDMFYIPADEEANIDSILTALGTSPTLTVSAAPRFVLRGGMIGFVMDDEDRVKMEANLANLKKRNVKIDPGILEIMQQVVGN